ncbi:hypothetical protein SKAU_G00130120 [Synaphobranchus kaupii]|uniref:Uncharacterized protein n=1 Tax=Synaphobranchus kaupii TaxID=118154 RepID=A0A9Q1FQ90_SYNKA|nr:hypothetical protein SKAU_G00130120 [Synaphobranchus kaupii]
MEQALQAYPRGLIPPRRRTAWEQVTATCPFYLSLRFARDARFRLPAACQPVCRPPFSWHLAEKASSRARMLTTVCVPRRFPGRPAGRPDDGSAVSAPFPFCQSGERAPPIIGMSLPAAVNPAHLTAIASLSQVMLSPRARLIASRSVGLIRALCFSSAPAPRGGASAGSGLRRPGSAAAREPSTEAVQPDRARGGEKVWPSKGRVEAVAAGTPTPSFISVAVMDLHKQCRMGCVQRARVTTCTSCIINNKPPGRGGAWERCSRDWHLLSSKALHKTGGAARCPDSGTPHRAAECGGQPAGRRGTLRRRLPARVTVPRPDGRFSSSPFRPAERLSGKRAAGCRESRAASLGGEGARSARALRSDSCWPEARAGQHC